jgi:cell division septum initiation protein DivIVA
MKETELSVPEEVIASKIFVIRDLKVMLDSDLAELYQVETKRLNEQVKRNEKRFPDDFMFQLTEQEWESLKSQNATSSWGGRRTLPYAFTEHGVLMLSSVLNSDRAIAVNIKVIRVYNKLKEMLLTHKDLLLKMEEMEKKVAGQDDKIMQIFSYLKRFIQDQETPRKQIGFKSKDTSEE